MGNGTLDFYPHPVPQTVLLSDLREHARGAADEDHESFRARYADALRHIPWDFHEMLDGVSPAGWAAEFSFRHVGEWPDDPST